MDLELVHERAYSAVGEMRGLFRPEECKRSFIVRRKSTESNAVQVCVSNTCKTRENI